MQSQNFRLLESRWPDLYKHGSFAEQYVRSDPPTATIKLRCFAETLVGTLYRELQLPSEPGDGLFEKINADHFEAVVESPIRQKMHAIRCQGNKAAHGGEIGSGKAVKLLKEAYLLGRWLYQTYSDDICERYPDFSVPEPQDEADAVLSAENEELSVQLEQAKRELAAVQSAELEAQQQISDLNASLDEARLEVFRKAASRASGSINLESEDTRRLLKLEDAFAEYTLTEGQADLVKQLGEFLSCNSESVFLLRGYAGTGKTFITKGLTEYFRSIGRNYVLAAPTGKASKVIAKKTKSAAYTLHKTIYSFKDIAEYRDENLDGTETYKFYAQLAVNELSADTVFVVDEASMVADVYSEAEFFRFGSGYLLRDFLRFVNLDHNDHRKKVIFIGDDAQLPPVGMNFSPALDENYLLREYGVRTTSYELTEVVRQKAGSGVMRNSITLRKALQDGAFNQLTMDLSCPDVAMVEHSELMDQYLKSCGGKINGQSIVIAHSNTDVAAYNRRIREHFFPGCPYVAAGDKVMAVSNSNAYELFISNGDFGLVRKIRGEPQRRTITLKKKNSDTGAVDEVKVPLAFRDVEIGFKDLDDKPHFFEARILEDLLYSNQPSPSSDENKALYLDFCIRNRKLKRGSLEFRNTLMSDPYFNALRLKFGYAVTCHKAQGSEWNHVFVKCNTNQSQLSAGYFRWFYTAITRASRNLWLLDPPNISVGSGIKSVPALGIGLPQGSAGTGHSQGPRFTPACENGQFENASSERPRAEVSPSETTFSDGSDMFGIPEAVPFLRGLLNRVRELIADNDIDIEGIAHHQYQEVYSFRRGDEFARIDVGYNGKGKVTRVTLPVPTELSSQVKGLLAPLVDAHIAVPLTVSPDQFSFSEKFLNELHQRVVPLAIDQRIKIQNVVRQPWNLRYTFGRDGEVAVYDIFFNGKKRFTKCQPLLSDCTPGQLVGDVEVLLTQGLDEAATRSNSHQPPHDLFCTLTPSIPRRDFATHREELPAWTPAPQSAPARTSIGNTKRISNTSNSKDCNPKPLTPTPAPFGALATTLPTTSTHWANPNSLTTSATSLPRTPGAPSNLICTA